MIRYEIKKIFSRTISKICLLILAVTLGVTSYFAISHNTYLDENGNEHTGIAAMRSLYEKKREWSGLITEEYLQKVIRENDRINAEYPYDPQDPVSSDIGYAKAQGFSDAADLINAAFSKFREYDPWKADSVTEEEVGTLYVRRIQNLKEWLASDEARDQFSEAEKEYLIQRYETLETPFYYEPADSWNVALEYAPSITMITLLVLSFLVSGIFSNEFQWRADAVFFSSRFGRDKGTLTKMAAGITVITGIYWGMVLLYSLIVFGTLGTSGAQCVIHCDWRFGKSLYHITFWQAYLLTIVGGYVGNLFVLLVSMLVSAKTHTSVVSVVIPFVIVFIQSFLGGIPILTDILGLLPDQLLQLNMTIRTFSLYEIGGKVIQSVPILLTVYPLLCLVMLPVLYDIYRKTEIK